MKKDFPKFKADFRKICEANGGVFSERDTLSDGAAFRIPTKYGMLRASIHCDAHHNWRGGVYLESIYLQFHDYTGPKEGPMIPGGDQFNRFSHKWNINFTAGSIRDARREALGEFMRRLELVKV